MELGERTLYPSRKTWVLVLGASLLFALAGLLMLQDSPVAAWFVIGLFGLGVLVAVLNLIPGSGYLRLTQQGYEVRVMFRTSEHAWNDIERFEAYQNPTSANRMVGVVFASDADRLPGTSLRKLNRQVIGVDGALPDTYGMSADRLADLMNQWLKEAKEQ